MVRFRSIDSRQVYKSKINAILGEYWREVKECWKERDFDGRMSAAYLVNISPFAIPHLRKHFNSGFETLDQAYSSKQ